eukprot:6204275-Pleurochrysis_carterae.AAC.2
MPNERAQRVPCDGRKQGTGEETGIGRIGCVRLRRGVARRCGRRAARRAYGTLRVKSTLHAPVLLARRS